MGWSTVNRARWAVKCLEAHGLVQQDPGVVRGLRVPGHAVDPEARRLKAQLMDANRLLRDLAPYLPPDHPSTRALREHLRRTDVWVF